MTPISPEEAERLLNTIVEELASIEHARWAHWQSYLHGQGIRQEDGSIVLPAPLVERWERQIATAYEDLTHEEKSADREQVMKYLPTIKKAILNGAGGTQGSGPAPVQAQKLPNSGTF
ncbi:hypothetical protein EIQ06_00950 [Xanthomonas campestris pv. campestris]|jgi:hypothetical protein|uniref:Uncharacterized protein n=2 Tax=Xanthomonas TaxID=338 RepID=B0RUS9_XANCB|nr:hypothetical protein BJD12_21730 [Xanthomonas vesicatoria ATCC 35937]EGD10861.1 hypothetical protein XVE_0791 [Xanthomonas vesicatoria ATCC 35937]KTF33642.1 hypothetical protein LMG920_08520 [Xanthomonas vesicatoria]CAP51998.1 hypothetical protein XCCB100_2637 [Xanthomonas campestris pv. campestris]